MTSATGTPRHFEAGLDTIPQLGESPLASGEWKRVKTLGSSKYGKVILVRTRPENSLQLPEIVAVKVMPKHVVLAPRRSVKSPLNEIHAALELARLQLPHVVKIYGAWQDAENVYLVSQYCAKGDLFTLVDTCGCFKTEEGKKKVFVQILSAVLFLHLNGIAHRDLCLESFLVDEDGAIRVIDFGQAIRVRDRCASNAPEARCLVDCFGIPGKPSYTPPELLRNGVSSAATGLSYLAMKMDMFHVGIALFTIMVGKYPVASDLFSNTEAGSSRCTTLGNMINFFDAAERVPPQCLDLLELLLAPNAELRPTALDALRHSWLASEACAHADAATLAAVENSEVVGDSAQNALNAIVDKAAVVGADPMLENCAGASQEMRMGLVDQALSEDQLVLHSESVQPTQDGERSQLCMAANVAHTISSGVIDSKEAQSGISTSGGQSTTRSASSGKNDTRSCASVAASGDHAIIGAGSDSCNECSSLEVPGSSADDISISAGEHKPNSASEACFASLAAKLVAKAACIPYHSITGSASSSKTGGKSNSCMPASGDHAGIGVASDSSNECSSLEVPGSSADDISISAGEHKSSSVGEARFARLAAKLVAKVACIPSLPFTVAKDEGEESSLTMRANGLGLLAPVDSRIWQYPKNVKRRILEYLPIVKETATCWSSLSRARTM